MKNYIIMKFLVPKILHNKLFIKLLFKNVNVYYLVKVVLKMSDVREFFNSMIVGSVHSYDQDGKGLELGPG